jgi:NAD(P)-dependent dehydrogenase (short-subunit alcohol dehydrogenase family)
MYTPSVMRATLSRMALKEIAVPEWIAPGAVFLASDDARFMTGQHLTLDGGYVMDGSLPGGAAFCKD